VIAVVDDDGRVLIEYQFADVAASGDAPKHNIAATTYASLQGHKWVQSHPASLRVLVAELY
jgi:hypothetical protein